MTLIATQMSSAPADCRPQGGNGSRRTNDTIAYQSVLQELLEQQWRTIQPKWFITLQWSPAPFSYSTATHHAKHFRNKLLSFLYQCRLKELPDPNDRCRLIWFHERTADPSGRLIYHSHLHLSELPPPYSTPQHLEHLIDTKVAPGFQCLKIHKGHNRCRNQGSRSAPNPAVVIKPWIAEHHAHYNLKDYVTYKHQQDGDLVLDLEGSDLIVTK